MTTVQREAHALFPRADPPWRSLELLLMSEVMRLVGQSLAPEVVLREMLHLSSELLGLNRGRIVLAAEQDDAGRSGEGPWASIRYAYGLTRTEMARGSYAPGEGITGAVLATGQPIIVQEASRRGRPLGRRDRSVLRRRAEQRLRPFKLGQR